MQRWKITYIPKVERVLNAAIDDTDEETTGDEV